LRQKEGPPERSQIVSRARTCPTQTCTRVS